MTCFTEALIAQYTVNIIVLTVVVILLGASLYQLWSRKREDELEDFSDEI